MKDVANCLGISKQVASKIVSPSNSRMLTAFELFRMSILTRRPIMDLISMDIYMTDDELKDTKLCEAVNGGYENTAEIRKLISYYKQLPEYIQHLVLMSLERCKKQSGNNAKNSNKARADLYFHRL